MDARLLETCESKFANHVEFLFEVAASLPGAANFLTAPSLELTNIGGLTFIKGHEPPKLRRRICGALCAREQFRQQAPAWAPTLPIRWRRVKRRRTATMSG